MVADIWLRLGLHKTTRSPLDGRIPWIAMGFWTDAPDLAARCTADLHCDHHSIALYRWVWLWLLLRTAFGLSLTSSGTADLSRPNILKTNSTEMAQLPSDAADATKAPSRTSSNSPPVWYDHDHPCKNFREGKWMIQTQVLAILLFIMYFFRVTTNATTGGGGADRGFIAMMDPENLLHMLYNGFPWAMAWPPAALLLTIPFSMLWGLLLAELYTRHARNAKKRQILWCFASLLNVIWFVAHLCSWLVIYVGYEALTDTQPASAAGGILMAIGVFGYYFTLVIIAIAELVSRDPVSSLIPT